MSKVTKWFPAEVRPVRIGWYERDYGSTVLNDHFDWWDGMSFRLGFGDGRYGGMTKVPRPWRGLASDPAKARK